MKSALVLGGTSFFGVNLVNRLLERGVAVSVATRSLRPADFHAEVTRLQVDRRSPESLKSLAASGTWDVLYDQIGFSGLDAQNLLDAFEGRVGKLVYTSSVSVYEAGRNIEEQAFKPEERQLNIARAANYEDGKRDAEAVYAHNGGLPFVVGRPAVVIGSQDARSKQHIQSILSGRPIWIENREAEFSLVTREDAGVQLADLGLSSALGAYNIAAPEPLKMPQFMEQIADELGARINYADAYSRACFVSPYSRSFHTSVSSAKAAELGLVAQELQDALPRIVQEIKCELGLVKSREVKCASIEQERGTRGIEL